MIYLDDWFSPTNILHNQIDLFSTQHSTIDDICVATSVRELFIENYTHIRNRVSNIDTQ